MKTATKWLIGMLAALVIFVLCRALLGFNDVSMAVAAFGCMIIGLLLGDWFRRGAPGSPVR